MLLQYRNEKCNWVQNLIHSYYSQTCTRNCLFLKNITIAENLFTAGNYFFVDILYFLDNNNSL